MNQPPFYSLVVALALGGLVGAGCAKKHDEGGHEHAGEKAEAEGHGHDRVEGGEPGATFKPGRGIILSEETSRNLGVETVEVLERKVPLEVRFTAQVFGEDHKHSARETHQAECSAKAAGLIAQVKARHVKPGQPAQVSTTAGESFGGVILGVNKALAIGDVEVLVGITNSTAELKPGDFLSIAISIPRDEKASAIPKRAVLRTAEGAFAYTQNGDASCARRSKLGQNPKAS